jgi:hypothetical protein
MMFRSSLLAIFAATPSISGVSGPDNIRLTISVVISLIILLAALWVILSNRYPPKVEHWAYGIIGTIVGFWLRGS